MAAAQVVHMAQPALDLAEFQELSVETTILTGIEKELLCLDEINVSSPIFFFLSFDNLDLSISLPSIISLAY